MCHSSVRAFVEEHVGPELVAGLRVLEVGSYDVNGSVRPHIESLGPAQYLGVDLRPGPLVDWVADACTPGLCASVCGPFDLVLCLEMLEHARDWRAAVENLKDCVAPGGLLLVTTRSRGFPLHEYPGDYWRYELGDMRAIFSDHDILALQEDPEAPGVLMFSRAAGRPRPDLSRVHLYFMLSSSNAPDGQH